MERSFFQISGLDIALDTVLDTALDTVANDAIFFEKRRRQP